VSNFDKLAGLSKLESLTRRGLKTLGEAGGDIKSTPDATMDYSDPPPETKLGDPNSAYGAYKTPKFGSNATLAGKEKKAADRTSKPVQHNTEAYVGFEKLKKQLAARGDVKDPAAVAASIGRKKYGAEKFAKAASAGKKLG
jgi:hypothetical protein